MTSDKNAKIHKKMTFGEVLISCPEAAEIMMKFGLHCVGCGAAHFETVEQGAVAHGLSAVEIDNMIDEIQKAVKAPKRL